MTNTQLPRPTRSTLLNMRLNKAINAMNGQFPTESGLRTAGRRSALPRARRADRALALAGMITILFVLFVITVS